jgi:hypothetical protein
MSEQMFEDLKAATELSMKMTEFAEKNGYTTKNFAEACIVSLLITVRDFDMLLKMMEYYKSLLDVIRKIQADK